MRILLDTHTFLWFIEGNTRLSLTARQLIEDSTNERLFSIASVWEMAIKFSLGRLKLSQPLATLIPQQLVRNRIDLLGIALDHTAVVSALPFHHHDPFDRLLISQAIFEQIPLISIDSVFDQYGVIRLW